MVRRRGAQATDSLWADSDAHGQGATGAQLQRGWERNALLSLYFGPSPASLAQPTASFETLAGKWVVAPVTDTLIYSSSRVRPELARWVDDVAKWDFTQIAPAHFDVRPGTPADLRAAFAPTLASAGAAAGGGGGERPYVSGDVRLLDDIAGSLVKLKVI